MLNIFNFIVILLQVIIINLYKKILLMSNIFSTFIICEPLVENYIDSQFNGSRSSCTL